MKIGKLARDLLKKSKDIFKEHGLDAIQGYTLEQAIRYINKHISLSEDALKYLRSDLINLLDDVYEYQANFEEAQTAMRTPRATDQDFLATCYVNFSADEILHLQMTIASVKILQKSIHTTEQAALARIKLEIQKHERLAEQEHRKIAEAKRRNHKNIADIYNGAYTEQIMWRNDFIKRYKVTDRTGDSLERIIQELIANLQHIHDSIVKDWPHYVRFSNQCVAWINSSR